MLISIINQVRKKLTDSGVKGVYSSFDALPTDHKGSCFTVVGVKSFSAESPLYAPFVVYFPFRAEVEITMLAPESWSMEQLYDIFNDNVEPVILEMSGLSARLTSIALKPDSNLHRMTLKAVMSISGTHRIERSTP